MEKGRFFWSKSGGVMTCKILSSLDGERFVWMREESRLNGY
jgi:hypothetical protein